MAFVKFVFAYTLCTVALVLYQSNFVRGKPETCITCSSNGTDANSTCTYAELTPTGHPTCNATSHCTKLAFKVEDGYYTQRGCDLDCETMKKAFPTSFGWRCDMCEDVDLCNRHMIPKPIPKCVVCNSVEMASSSQCSNDDVNSTIVRKSCEATKNCGTVTFTDEKGVYTERGCDFDCETRQLDNVDWACEVCNDADSCNKKSIAPHVAPKTGSAPPSMAATLVPLALSSIAAFYCY